MSAPRLRLHTASPQGDAAGQPLLLTMEEAAAALNVPVNWLRKKVSAREVAHTRLGKHVRFTREHLDDIIATGDQPAVADAPSADGVSRRARRAG
jgi:excisionase family DNA binding protein